MTEKKPVGRPLQVVPPVPDTFENVGKAVVKPVPPVPPVPPVLPSTPVRPCASAANLRTGPEFTRPIRRFP